MPALLENALGPCIKAFGLGKLASQKISNKSMSPLEWECLPPCGLEAEASEDEVLPEMTDQASNSPSLSGRSA